MSGFYDLNIPVEDLDSTRDVLKKLAAVGYKTVAVNRTVEIDKGTKVVESAENRYRDEVFPVQGHRFPLRVASRLTLLLKENAPLYLLSNENIASYDILAVAPTTDKQFQKVCTELEVDLISLDFGSRLPFPLRLPPVRAAIERGIHFEVVYSPALRDSSARCHIIAGAKQLVRLTRGKNVILSSEARTALETRAPYDVANLGLLFDWSTDQAKAAISKNARAVLCHAEARHGLGKAAVKVQAVSCLGPHHQWQVKSIEDCRRHSHSSAGESDSEEDEEEQEELEDCEEPMSA